MNLYATENVIKKRHIQFFSFFKYSEDLYQILHFIQ